METKRRVGNRFCSFFIVLVETFSAAGRTLTKLSLSCGNLECRFVYLLRALFFGSFEDWSRRKPNGSPAIPNIYIRVGFVCHILLIILSTSLVYPRRQKGTSGEHMDARRNDLTRVFSLCLLLRRYEFTCLPTAPL